MARRYERGAGALKKWGEKWEGKSTKSTLFLGRGGRKKKGDRLASLAKVFWVVTRRRERNSYTKQDHEREKGLGHKQ